MEILRTHGLADAVYAAGEPGAGVASGDTVAGEWVTPAPAPDSAPVSALSPCSGWMCDQQRMEPVLFWTPDGPTPEPGERVTASVAALGHRYPGDPSYDPDQPVQDPATPDGAPGTRAPHVPLSGPVASTLDLFDPDGFTLVCAAGSRYDVPVPGVQVRAVRSETVLDRARWDGVYTGPGRDGLLIRPDGFVCWRAASDEPDRQQAVRNARARALARDTDRPSHDASLDEQRSGGSLPT